MIVRNKSGEFRVADSSVLLDFLGVKKEAAGVQKVAGDVELIAPVPFCLSADTGESSKGVPAIPDGIAWVFSTFDLDRYDERIDPAGWDYSQFLKNPVIEWAHCYDIPAIGRAEGITADDTGLHGVIVFNDKTYDPFGWGIGERVKAGVIRAGSVGFRVIEIEIPDRETAKDGTTLIFRKQELLEFSICNVPANPYALTHLALAKSVEKKATDITQDLSCPQTVGSAFWGGLINNFQGANNG